MRVRAPPINSAVARALTNLGGAHQSVVGGGIPVRWPSLPSGATTPSSQPSSPMRKEPSPFKFPHESSAFELSRRHNTGVSQKIARLLEDRYDKIYII